MLYLKFQQFSFNEALLKNGAHCLSNVKIRATSTEVISWQEDLPESAAM